MKLGIVGGNSQVATELAFLMRDRGYDVVPIVRNVLGSQFLSYHGFDVRIGSVTDPTEAKRLLGDVDAVVVAAFAWQLSRDGFHPGRSREINEALIENSAAVTRTGTPVIYFSSIAAFGSTLGHFSDLDLYTQEKRNAERTLSEACKRHEKPGYALRLGVVFGHTQSAVQSLVMDVVDGRDVVRLAVDGEKPANIVHTVTIADAIDRCIERAVTPGTYTLVNEPNWTWQQTYEYYAPEHVTLRFEGRQKTDAPPLPRRALGSAFRVADAYEGVIRSGLTYLPDTVNERLFKRYVQNRFASEIGELRSRRTFDTHHFAYNPAPGPFVPGLTDTETLLERSSAFLDSALGVEEVAPAPA